MIGAMTSLKVKTLVPERRKLNKQVRDDVFSFLTARNIGFIACESNCFMLDTKRPAREFIKDMAAQKIFVGRAWPSMPNHSRITVGTRDEMEKFKTALLKVMA
jgi:histidinol-phosphate/aromatic aminotransferase/cobyric acid decarboxylase-like protein